MPDIEVSPEWVHAATLRSIANSIEPLFPDAAGTLRGIAHATAAEDRMREGSWACGRCGEAPELHASSDSRCVYDPVWKSAASAAAQAWDEGYAARRSEDIHSPCESNPYRAALDATDTSALDRLLDEARAEDAREAADAVRAMDAPRRDGLTVGDA